MPGKIPLDTSVEAEYEDGYTHSETELDDVSPYQPGKNVFYDILERRPEAEHGRMVRFSCFYLDRRYDIEWRGMPDSARPVRFRHGFSTFDPGSGVVLASGWTGVDFGYQWNDEDGRNRQEIHQLRPEVSPLPEPAGA
jgi:hypothetical protein